MMAKKMKCYGILHLLEMPIARKSTHSAPLTTVLLKCKLPSTMVTWQDMSRFLHDVKVSLPATSSGDQVPQCELPIFVKKKTLVGPFILQNKQGG